jgi:hypothetical protein
MMFTTEEMAKFKALMAFSQVCGALNYCSDPQIAVMRLMLVRLMGRVDSLKPHNVVKNSPALSLQDVVHDPCVVKGRPDKHRTGIRQRAKGSVDPRLGETDIVIEALEIVPFLAEPRLHVILIQIIVDHGPVVAMGLAAEA